MNDALGNLADAVDRALDEAEEAGVPLDKALDHLRLLSELWRPTEDGQP